MTCLCHAYLLCDCLSLIVSDLIFIGFRRLKFSCHLKKLLGNMSQYMHSIDQVTTGPILVQQYRKSSWDKNMAQTLEFINTKLENKGQLIDVSLTMSNTDWLACIHIYYYKDIQTMKQFGRNPKDYLKHGNLLCAWKRYKESWMNSAKEAINTIETMSQTKGKLFGIKHACGNHAFTHGGPVIFILYWDGIKSKQKKTNQQEGQNDGNDDTKQNL
eukprot:395880_1